MAAREYDEANEVFTQLVTQSASRSDVYGRLGLASLAFASIPADLPRDRLKVCHYRASYVPVKLYGSGGAFMLISLSGN